MVKDFKYIIRKIIIGVGICIAMYFFRNYLVIGVNAKSYDFNITKLESTTTGNVTVTTSPPTEFQQQGAGSFFGFVGQTTPNTNTWSHLTWTLQKNNDCKSGLKNISYIFSSAFDTPNLINRYAFTIEGYNGNKYSCLSDASNIANSSGSLTKTFVSVMCPNVYYDSNVTYVVRAYTNGGASPGAYWGITRPTFTDTEGGEIQSAVNEGNAIQQETQDFLKDDEEASTDDFIDDLKSNESSDSPVSDLIVMPITLLQAYLNGFDATCGSYNLGTLYGHQITLPCIQPQRYLGSSLWSTIDILISLFLTYNVGLMCISIYESITSLDDNFQNLYTPRHAKGDYQPKHAKE